MSGVAHKTAIRAARAAAGVAAVGAATAVLRAVEIANATTVALSFLLIVLAVAARWGLVEAIAASVTATLCFNFFFLPPVGTFTIADPQNWVALLAFLAVSVVASHLSETARAKAREAETRQEETERLYSLSRMTLLLSGTPAEVAGEVPRLLLSVYNAAGVALFHQESGQVLFAGAVDAAQVRTRLEEAARQGRPFTDDSRQSVTLPVTLGGKTLGSLAIAGASLSDGARQAIANLVALALESASSRAATSQAETARRSEEFKSTLLDALAHELKTPLTSVKAAVTALQSGAAASSEQHRELLAIIGEESDRLNRLISDAVRMARIEASTLQPKLRPCAPAEIVRAALEEAGRATAGRQVQVSVSDSLPAVTADPELIRVALGILMQNAAAYSPPQTPIRIRAGILERFVCFRVADEGPGIAAEERERVFQKYYRGSRAGSAPGLGLGLGIAREIISAHGGRIWTEDAEGGGAQFSFTLPVAETERKA